MGLLNGVGGHVDPGETPHKAIAREFEEEAGVSIGRVEFYKYATFLNDMWMVHFFRGTLSDLSLAKTVTDERIVKVDANDLPDNVVDNLRWLIPLAKDKTLESPVLFNIR
jgi:8-oxo-dGTP diphosphatase